MWTIRIPKRWHRRALVIAMSLVGITVALLCVFRYGNPQWHKRIYIFQVYTWPRFDNAELPPGFDGGWGPSDRSGVRPPVDFSGVWFDWDKRGNKTTETSYAGGRKHGLCIKYGGDGVKFSEETFQNGLRHGKMTVWQHGPKKKSFECNFRNRNLDGQATWWDDKGNVIAKGVYKMGGVWNGSFVEMFGGLPRIVNEYKEGNLWNGRRPVDYANSKGLVQIIAKGVVVDVEPRKVVQSVGGTIKSGKPWLGRFERWDNDKKRFVIETFQSGVLVATMPTN